MNIRFPYANKKETRDKEKPSRNIMMKRTHRRTTHTVLYVLRSVRRCLRTFSRGSFEHLQTQANTVNRRQASGAEHPVERLAEDHANAKLFAEHIAMIPGIALDPPLVTVDPDPPVAAFGDAQRPQAPPVHI